MEKRKVKRLNPKNGISAKINEFYKQTEEEKEAKLLKLITDIIVRITLEDIYSHNSDE